MRKPFNLTSDVVVDIVLATLAAFLCVIIDYTNKAKDAETQGIEETRE